MPWIIEPCSLGRRKYRELAFFHKDSPYFSSSAFGKLLRGLRGCSKRGVRREDTGEEEWGKVWQSKPERLRRPCAGAAPGRAAMYTHELCPNQECWEQWPRWADSWRLPASLTRALRGQRQENLVITVKESIPRTWCRALHCLPFLLQLAAVGPHNGPVS